VLVLRALGRALLALPASTNNHQPELTGKPNVERSASKGSQLE
jgi:hypothetical protein